MMTSKNRVLVTGAAGMVGRRLVSYLQDEGYTHITPLTRDEVDLEDRAEVRRFFADHRPEYVFHIAAKVGGIQANVADPVGFLKNNLLSQIHVMESCYQSGVTKLLFLGSSCIYPRECRQPMKEEYLLTGPLEPTNEGYALAKIAGLKLAAYYHKQYGMKVVCPMPCNIYGPGDSFDLNNSHVLSALVRRFVDAKESGAESVTLWGSGAARREFIYIDDVVRGLVFIMKNVDRADIINLGSGVDYTIRDLSEQVRRLTGFNGRVDWDDSKPDGMPRKCLDVSRLSALGFAAETPLEDGLLRVIADYSERKTREGGA